MTERCVVLPLSYCQGSPALTESSGLVISIFCARVFAYSLEARPTSGTSTKAVSAIYLDLSAKISFIASDQRWRVSTVLSPIAAISKFSIMFRSCIM